MKPQRLLPALVAGICVLSLVPGSRVDAAVVSGPSAGVVISSRGLDVWIGGPVITPPHPPVVHRPAVVMRPWRERFIRIGPRCEERVLVHRPEPVVVRQVPAVTIRPPVAVESDSITVWITNSNGSRTSVPLTRQGRWYVGPRGEYYDGMPTNEQLRTIYGF
jgi:hypothetical protein